ncbi:tRNA (N6-threonylcarbamoyladenosine(37)-N6)-methyltransferase TrmO [Gammaproteobacteria bacterium AB-CW1]|uniref:tRNA (N6-threonylcarbamoyladenosine(37)-N6)-methyltransferase TrmO n=1 Tax=Natronospira elongata TaxID=3110268 RepID=A0AAP6JDF6_9GAMM|nr:tRNA (N6-threonylcarbamoyladenosine(37)-N6)-methyltransferase TrmO [Gammaproteobacteria bacterium AB-CW1]
MDIIADLFTDFPEKFGIPRQAGQAPSSQGRVVLRPAFARPEAVRGLEGYSHIWLLFQFHQAQGWRPTVRPPRLGGNRRLGVFASRSPFRPNPIGLSVFRLEGIDCDDGVCLHVSGVDILDGTPVLDIKPYLPWADCVSAQGGFADEVPATLTVSLSRQAESSLAQMAEGNRLRSLLAQTLGLDPRPAYHEDPERIYFSNLAGLEVQWRICEDVVEVLSVDAAD